MHHFRDGPTPVKKLLLHAPNVHQGGGKALLSSLLETLAGKIDCVLLCDSRLDIPRPGANVRILSFRPSLAGRLTAEWRLRSLASKDDVVLCMGNLPPLLALPSRTFLFLQNRYLCEPVPLTGFVVSARLRIAVERFWVRHFLRNVSRVIVQTPSMRESLRRNLGATATVMPFAPAITVPGTSTRLPPAAKRFLYPASADPHKNHQTLIEAWRLLHAGGLAAELHLTVRPDAALARDVSRLARDEGLPIINHGEIGHTKLAELYGLADALIFPSKLESFGLPLVEARALGLPIIAAELDFVRDVVVPTQTFDPASPVSIARAVRRFIGAPEQPVALSSTADFVQWLIDGRA